MPRAYNPGRIKTTADEAGERSMKSLRTVTALAACVLLQPAWAQTTSSEGRLLASNCFQCHAAQGQDVGFDSLAGKSKKELLHELREMRARSARTNIMNAHAHGFTNEQLALIAGYFASLPKR